MLMGLKADHPNGGDMSEGRDLTRHEQEELNGALADYCALIETRDDARLAEAMFRAGLAAARVRSPGGAGV